MQPLSFKRHRFPPDTIRLAVWLYFRFTTSLRDVEEMLAERDRHKPGRLRDNNRVEPPRLFRRQFCLAHATISRVSMELSDKPQLVSTCGLPPHRETGMIPISFKRHRFPPDTIQLTLWRCQSKCTGPVKGMATALARR